MIRELVLICKIWKWHKKTFVDLPEQAQYNKFDSEIKEYMQEFENYMLSKNPKRKRFFEQKMKKEAVDVIISGINLLKYPEFFECVALKHNENANHRTWKGVHHDVSAK